MQVVVVVDCDDSGNVDVADLKAKAGQHAANLACLMITYPSTHGVFEEAVRESAPSTARRPGVLWTAPTSTPGRPDLARPSAPTSAT